MTINEAMVTETASALAPRLAAVAPLIVESLTETHYTHKIHIDAAAGVFDLDCSGFVSHLLQQVADRHYKMVAASSSVCGLPAGGEWTRTFSTAA
jgi:hypothetical protein